MPRRPVESSPGQASGAATPTEGGLWLAKVQEALDRLLVLDVFLVLAGAGWFGLGVILHMRGTDSPLAAFQRLWFPLFQPALGLLMLAALLSGGLGWWRRRGQR